MGEGKNASAMNVLLGCIFLYIHICFYTATLHHLSGFTLCFHIQSVKISLVIKKNFVIKPSYYNYTHCVHCKGWD